MRPRRRRSGGAPCGPATASWLRRASRTIGGTVRTLLRVAIAIALLAVAAWWGLALHFRLPGPGWLATAVSLAHTCSASSWCCCGCGRSPRAVLAILASFASCSRCGGARSGRRTTATGRASTRSIPYGELDGDRLTLHNVRNFDYRSETDFTERWETRTYDLSKLAGRRPLHVVLGLAEHRAHHHRAGTFADGAAAGDLDRDAQGAHGETYSAVRGFFREYEIYYVAADERDLIRLRTNYRGEDVYLYRAADAARSRARAPAGLREEHERARASSPRWYNALTHNCTTTIRDARQGPRRHRRARLARSSPTATPTRCSTSRGRSTRSSRSPS